MNGCISSVMSMRLYVLLVMWVHSVMRIRVVMSTVYSMVTAWHGMMTTINCMPMIVTVFRVM